MHDITNENKLDEVNLKKGWDVATKLGGKALDATVDAFSYPFKKKGFSNPADATTVNQVNTSARTQADIAALQKSKLDAVKSDKFTPDQLADIDRRIDNLQQTQKNIDIKNTI